MFMPLTTPRLLTALALVVAAAPVTAQSAAARSQLAFEGSPTFAGAVSYARRVQDSRVLLGLGTGFAWELNDHSFSREVWNVMHVEAFARYQPVPWFQGDLGLYEDSGGPRVTR